LEGHPVKLIRISRLAVPLAVGALLLSACGGNNNTDTANASGNGGGSLSGAVKIDGSSTVAPLSTAAAELFKEEAPGVNVTVGTSGTGGGFEKFCAGETDISDASRPIDEAEEVPLCEEAGIEFAEIPVANDALTVVVNAENDWVDCLTTEQLGAIWEPGSTVSSWKDVDSSFPDEKLELFGPGTDSGTFDYFTDVINGEEGASREDYSPSEDDNVIVQGVSGSSGGLGYFGYTYFEENSDTLKALEIDSGNGCVAPSAETAQDGTYTPLSRPLFIYPAKGSIDKPQVKAFLEFYLENDADIAEAAQYIPLNDEQKSEAQSAYDSLLG
jgi:phosphate transport system substrate-binding protein